MAIDSFFLLGTAGTPAKNLSVFWNALCVTVSLKSTLNGGLLTT